MGNRINRINEEVKREISSIIMQLKDPRINSLTSVVAVDVTKDLRYAKVYVSVLGDEKSQEETINGLTSAAGFIRREIGHKLKLRNTPEISFIADRSIEHGAKINKILKDLEKNN
jgi:ribosome-binding factor A